MNEKYTYKIFLKKKNKYFSNGRKSTWSRTVDVIYHITSLRDDGLTDDDFEIHIYPISRAIIWTPSDFLFEEKENIKKRETRKEKAKLEQELFQLNMRLKKLSDNLKNVDNIEREIIEIKNKINNLKND